MRIDRRGVLVGGLAGLGGLAGASLLPASRALSATAGVPEGLHRSSFEAVLGQDLQFLDGRWQYTIATLIEVANGPAAEGLEQYTLVFEALPGRTAPTGLCYGYGAATGLFQLHLEPAQGDAGDCSAADVARLL